MKKIIVASENLVKLNATLRGFQRMFPEEKFSVEGHNISSGVSDQPLSDSETYQGACNRAEGAFAAQPDADYWVGLEGGIETKNSDMEAFAWIVVRSKSGQAGKGKTGVFFLPPKIAQLVHAGKELGEADDIVSGKTNSKQAGGTIGFLTGDTIDRASYYTEAVVLALIPFKNPQHYPYS